MPVETVVGITEPTWVHDFQWPYRYQQAAAAEPGAIAVLSAGEFITGTIPTNLGRAIESYNQTPGGSVRASGYYNGMWAFRLQNGAVNGCANTWGYLPLFPSIGLAASYAPGTVTAYQMRAVWIQVTLAMAAGAVWSDTSGFAVMNAAAALTGNQWAGGGGYANLGAFGIFGSGAANGLLFRAYDNVTPGPAGVLTQVAIPAPAAPGAWRSFDFFITGGSPSRDATLDVYVGGTLLAGASGLRFTNLAGGLWWDAAANNLFNVGWRHGAVGAGNTMYISHMRIRTGAFTRDGAPLTN